MPSAASSPRFHCPLTLSTGQLLALPAGAARHVQVLRLQPGSPVTLFDGRGGEYEASIERMGRSEVEVRVGAHRAIEREPSLSVHLALGVPANERMDWLVEKATELGVASITPLLTERTVLRLSGDRAAKRQAHWHAIAAAACEQSGRNRLPVIAVPQEFATWLSAPMPQAQRCLLSLDAQARPLARAGAPGQAMLLLSGPEGGLAPAEIQAALANGFEPVSLGARVLRAETAPLAALSVLTLAAS